MGSIGNRVQEIREGNGLSIRQLARQADLADETVSKIEAGTANPTMRTLEKIAEVLGCRVGDFMD